MDYGWIIKLLRSFRIFWYVILQIYNPYGINGYKKRLHHKQAEISLPMEVRF